MLRKKEKAKKEPIIKGVTTESKGTITASRVNNSKVKFTEKDAQKALKANSTKAKELLADEKSMNGFLSQVNEKFNAITGLKDKISDIPIIVSLVRSYIKGEYRTLPIGSLIGLVGALIYFVSPIDAIPDVIPGIGHMDDMVVLGVAIKFAYTDLEDYKKWLAERES